MVAILSFELGNIYFLTGSNLNCGSPTNPANGQVDTPSGTTSGSVAIYNCDSGYRLTGTSTRTCVFLASFAVQWSPSAPFCVCKFIDGVLVSNNNFINHLFNWI